MGKIILCAGKMAENGWLLPDGTHAWSVEELCFYVYENIYSIEQDFYGENLLEWLEKECGMPELAQKLDWLKEGSHSMKDMTVALMCGADYYTEQEINSLIRQIKELENMPVWKRKKKVADEFVKKRRYAKGLAEYERILADCDMTNEERAFILHNTGVTKLYLSSLADAADSFQIAWQMGHHPESLKMCLLAWRMADKREEYQRVLSEESVSQEFLQMVEQEWSRSLSKADRSKEMQGLQGIIGDEQTTERLKQLYHCLDDWKNKYREQVRI